MGEKQSMMDDLIRGLKQQRDELALQIHLGKQDAQDEWEKVQAKLSQLSEEYQPVRDAVEESAGNVFESLKLVAGEIKESFDRIKKSIVAEKGASKHDHP